MKESKSSRVSSDAMKAIRFSEKAQNGIKYVGGNKLTHQACSYGMALKWLIYTRKMTYEQFGKLYNGTTGQNINHLINRCAKERFFEEDLEYHIHHTCSADGALCSISHGLAIDGL